MSCCAGHAAAQSTTSWLLDFFTSSPLLATIVLGPVIAAILAAYPLLIWLSPRPLEPTPDELRFYTAADLLAYNEKHRLPSMLEETLAFLNRDQALSRLDHAPGKNISTACDALREPLARVEIIVVDDGSSDGTGDVVLEHARNQQSRWGKVELRLIRLSRNRGKGGAVRHGMLHARGALLLFVDADGATKFEALSALATELDRIRTPAGHGIVAGSRAHLVGSDQVVKRSFVRNLLMHTFHLVLSLLMRPPAIGKVLQRHLPSFLVSQNTLKRTTLPSQPEIRDTQCGFKLFMRESARVVFQGSHIERWIFDVELLLRAELSSQTAHVRLANCGSSMREVRKEAGFPLPHSGKGKADTVADVLLDLPLPIAEVPVQWTEVSGSKIDLLKDSLGMALDLVIIRANYALDRWPSPKPAKV
ncbi:Glycosyltransferase [Ceraceosorus bombacis]|uniref:dolichyl-phosphate beta-glucosyltransferase n=1 Tax=Ceraceosorus bombacis TaxID=401625 RepID=A0A0P1BJ79_9BASI|nr:Glycosyltransferase [Ceraceosorus bombacis]